MPKFEFSLQAKLQAEIDARDQALRALHSARSAVAHEQRMLDDLEYDLRQHREKIQSQLSDLADPDDARTSSDRVARGELYLRRLERELDDLQRRATTQRERLEAVVSLWRLREREAAASSAAVGALERLSDRSLKEFKLLQQGRADADNDEAASQLWVRESRREEPNNATD